MIPRYFVSVNLAAFITFGMFLAMHFLISNGEIVLIEKQIRPKIDFGIVRKPYDEPGTKVDLPVPPEITNMPEIPEIEIPGVNPVGLIPKDDKITMKPPISDITKSIFVAEGDLVPIVKPAPQYPVVMLEKGIEGFVRVQFTVTKEGMTSDVKVVESSHQGFERSAIKAALGFKFKPRVVNGEAVAVNGVTNIIEFKLAN